MWAAEQRHPEAVKALLAAGADHAAKSGGAGVPRNYMAQRVNTRTVEEAQRRRERAKEAGRTYEEQLEWENANGIAPSAGASPGGPLLPAQGGAPATARRSGSRRRSAGGGRPARVAGVGEAVAREPADAEAQQLRAQPRQQGGRAAQAPAASTRGRQRRRRTHPGRPGWRRRRRADGTGIRGPRRRPRVGTGAG